MTAVDELGAVVRRVAEQVGPSVVGIGNGWRGGSGIVISDGVVLTNAHNVRGDEPVVVFADGREARGTVGGVDPDGDLAVIHVDTGEAPALDWSEASVEVGTPIVALARPGGRGLRATLGFVSATERMFRGPRGRRIGGGIEHTAPLAPGSSGGPALLADGKLVGIDTSRVGEGFYLAIPADAALRRRVEALSRDESVERPRLGLEVAPAHVARRMRRAVGLPERDGLLVRDVEEGSPAAAGGIVEGDLVVTAAGRPIASIDDLLEALGAAEAGSAVDLTLARGTEERSVSVTPVR